MGEFVRVQIDQAIATIRLERPPMNAISSQLQTELAEAAAGVADDEQVRAVVLYGGEKVFAAGADIKEMADASYSATATRSRRLQDALSAVARIGKPVVAAITGYALGGGLELALCADFRVAGEKSKVGRPGSQVRQRPRCRAQGSKAGDRRRAGRGSPYRPGNRAAAFRRPLRDRGRGHGHAQLRGEWTGEGIVHRAVATALAPRLSVWPGSAEEDGTKDDTAG